MRPRIRSSPATWPAVRHIHSTRLVLRQPVEQHDIVVLGGGPAGLALTAALASSKSIASTHKLTLLESSLLSTISSWSPATAKAYSNRVSSITADNALFLRDAGVWQHLDHARTRPIDEIQVWDGMSDARLVFNDEAKYGQVEVDPWAAQQYGSEQQPQAMATLLENLNLQRASLRALEQHVKKNDESDVELLDGRKVLSIEMDEESGWPVIELSEGKNGEPARSLRARLLIGADGYNSPVKAYSKIDTFGWAYDANGIVATMHIRPEDAIGGSGMSTMWQRFLPEGPIAFLPLSDTTASLVWSTTPQLATAIKAIPRDMLPALVNAAFTASYERDFSRVLDLVLAASSSTDKQAALSSALEALSSSAIAQTTSYDPSFVPPDLPPPVDSVEPTSVTSFPLRLSHTSSYLGEPVHGRDRRTALVGDAAHTIHPLAGQGLNMGLGDVSELVRVLEETFEDGGDVGSFTALRPYPRSRYVPNHALLSSVDHLNTLYRSRSRAVVWARSTGLETINELDFVKKLFMAGAGGHRRSAARARARWSARGEQGRGVGAWGLVADGIESARSGVRLAGAVGGMMLGQLRGRVGEMMAPSQVSSRNAFQEGMPAGGGRTSTPPPPPPPPPQPQPTQSQAHTPPPETTRL